MGRIRVVQSSGAVSDTNQLLLNLILYGLLPLWGISGFIDWCCHRATHVERTSGIKESLIHSLMGLQLGIPILLCLLFRINVLILLICAFMCLLHEIVAHWDVSYASPLRRISIWEVHVHNYMATVPLYLFMLIVVLNWQVAIKTVTLQWANEFSLQLLPTPRGSNLYLLGYLAFMTVLCVFPYLEEIIRCIRYARSARRSA
jgi:hypothetical protein